MRYQQIVHHTPDIVLLDWMLPGGTGIELLRRLKKEAATQHVPVIMLTAKAHEDNVIHGLGGGRGRLHHQAFRAQRTYRKNAGAAQANG